MIQAQPDCCQEAAILPPGFDAYIPCNKPATKVIGWKGRSDAPLRMCDMCAHHNVKNRGGYEVSVYPPPEQVTPKRVPLQTYAKPQKTDYPTEVVEKYEARLPQPFFAILMLASAGDEASIGSTLSLPAGTVKSRLHRARKAIAALIAADTQGTCGLCEKPAKLGEPCPHCGTDTVGVPSPARPSTVLGSD